MRSVDSADLATAKPASGAEAAASRRSEAATGVPMATPAGGCPPPLQWQEVLREFYARADAWYLDRPNYRLTGKTLGNGPPLYLLNGIGGTLDLYALLAWLLKDEFRCVLYDYPGTQAVSPATRNLTLDDLVDDLLAIAGQGGDEAFSVYATSFGGLIGLSALLQQPARIERMVLQGGFAHRELSRFERLLVQAFRFSPGRLRRLPLRKAIQTTNHRRWFPPFDTTRFEFFLANAGQVPVATLAHRSAIVRDADLRPRLSEIRQPVLLIRGEGEGSVSEECQGILERGLPPARSEWLHGTGHLPYLTHPHRLAKLIRGFLSDE